MVDSFWPRYLWNVLSSTATTYKIFRTWLIISNKLSHKNRSTFLQAGVMVLVSLWSCVAQSKISLFFFPAAHPVLFVLTVFMLLLLVVLAKYILTCSLSQQIFYHYSSGKMNWGLEVIQEFTKDLHANKFLKPST